MIKHWTPFALKGIVLGRTSGECAALEDCGTTELLTQQCDQCLSAD